MNSVLPQVRKLNGDQGRVPFVAVVREVAPTESVPEDDGPEGLGVGEYQRKYFDGNPVYWDEDQRFVKEMGNRQIQFKFKAPWWQPWAIWSEIQDGLQKLQDKGVDGNMKGDGLIQGGVICVGPGSQGVTFTHFEENDLDVGMPADAIVNGVRSFEF